LTVDGADVAHLAAATGLHCTTVRRRVDKLVEDGVAEKADGLVHLPRHLAADEGLRPDPDQLEQVALARVAAGLGDANGTAISGASAGPAPPPSGSAESATASDARSSVRANTVSVVLGRVRHSRSGSENREFSGTTSVA
jgi:DNA-binding Lrp family transcriptional regulator